MLYLWAGMLAQRMGTMVRMQQRELDMLNGMAQCVSEIGLTLPQLSLLFCLLTPIPPPLIKNWVSFLHLPGTFGLIDSMDDRVNVILCIAPLLAAPNLGLCMLCRLLQLGANQVPLL